MDKSFVWKAEIVFKGTASEFNRLTEMLEKAPVEVNIPDWKDIPHHLAGCSRFPLERIVGIDRINKIIEGMPRIACKFPIPIPGGIRPPHLHIGNEIVLLDHDRFRDFASTVASELATILVNMEGNDHVEVMGPINQIVDRIGPTQFTG